MIEGFCKRLARSHSIKGGTSCYGSLFAFVVEAPLITRAFCVYGFPHNISTKA